MSLVAIILIIVAGITLLLIEFLIIPGVSVFGIAGFLCLIGGVITAYVSIGNTAGHITLAAAVAASVLSMLLAFRRKTWRKMGLPAALDSRMVTIEPGNINSGDTGRTITRLNPMGKVRGNDITGDAKSVTGYIDEDTEIEVIKISRNQLIVKPKT